MKNRIFYLEVLRVVACLAVVMIHASARYVSKNIGSFDFWVANVLDSFVRVGVPLFVMISGTLMLDKDYKYTNKKLINHITRMIIFFIFWSIIYYMRFGLIEPLMNNETISLKNSIKTIIEGHYHLWFVYMIVGIYLIVPFLRLWVKEENKKYVEYYIVLATIFTFLIPQIVHILVLNNDYFEFLENVIDNKLRLTYVGGFTTYFILGWYLNNFDIKNKKMVYSLGMVGLLISIIGTYILAIKTGVADYMYENLNINILFQGVAVFVFVKDKLKDKNTNSRVVSFISKYSLGIYAIHVLFITDIYRKLVKMDITSAIVSIPIVFILSLILSFITSIVLNRFPLIKRVV